MHCNLSLAIGDENAFYDSNGELQISDTARSFIAGILNILKGLTAGTNPTVNS